MTRRGLTIGWLCIVLVGLAVPAARAAAPEGPRLAINALTLRGPQASLFTAGADGTQPATLLQVSVRQQASKPLPTGVGTWLPDGQTLVFAGIAGAESAARTGRARTTLFTIPADGGRPHALAGTSGGEDPILSPDGHTIAFARRKFVFQPRHSGGNGGSAFSGTSTWLADIAGGPARRITPWRNGLDVSPSSFSPDGLSLGLTRARNKGGSEAVAVRLDTGAETVLAKSASEPVYSPDGSRIALLRIPARDHAAGARIKGNELIVIGADGSGEVRLTAASQGAVAVPRWDPSGQRLAFVQFERHQSLDKLLTEGDSIFEINADGTCPTEIFSAPGMLYTGAAWQPGPGREAPPLSC